MDHEDLIRKLHEKIVEGQHLMEVVSNLKVNGIEKLEKKIKQEIRFLKKVTKSKDVKKEHLFCTNLHHFEAVVSCLSKSHDPVAVLQSYYLSKTDGSSRKICVDIVAEKGHQWIKVIARNPKALSQVSIGDGEFGQRSIIDHAVDYLECASQHPHLFKPPKVVFEFACGIETNLANKFNLLGINVSGERLQNCDLNIEESDSASDDELQVCSLGHSDSCSTIFTSKTDSANDYNQSDQKLNLDVTTMLAYVSSLTNGHSNFEFKEPILSQQAEWERSRPVKPVLDQLFEGKSLFCCESAMRDFKSIVSTLGGPGERSRTNDLIARITVVPNLPSIRTQGHLKLIGKIKRRSLEVFSTGDALRAVTVTANEGFIRAARSQGVEFAVFLHESRALTEGKECDARILVQPESSVGSSSESS